MSWMTATILSLTGAAAAGGASEGTTRVHVLDLTGDGSRDLLTQRADGSLEVAVHVGGRRFVPVSQELPLVHVVDVLVEDLDSDGALDLYLVAHGPNVALRGDGSGGFVDATRELGLADPGAGASVERTDLDGDGRADLLLTNADGQVIFWAEPGGTFLRATETPAGTISEPWIVASGGTLEDDSRGVPFALDVPRSGAGAVTAQAPPVQGAGFGAAPGPVGPTQTALIDFLDVRYVNDEAGEVGGLDVEPFSLSGEQVSTGAGDVSFLGGRVGVGTADAQASLHVVNGPQWSTWNYGANLLLSGTRNNALGFLDSTGASAYAIANAGGELTFASMPPVGNIVDSPQRRMLLNETGAHVFGELSPSGGVRFPDGTLQTSAQGGQGPQGPSGPQGPAGGLVLQFQGDGEPDAPPSVLGALWIDTLGDDDPFFWSVYLGIGTGSVEHWFELL